MRMIGILKYRDQAKEIDKGGKDPNSKRVLVKERNKGNPSLKLQMLEAT